MTNKRDLAWLLAVAGAAVLLCLPTARHVAWLGDEGILLHAAQRALSGHALYRDTFFFLPPGGVVLLEGWFAVTGVSWLSARVLAIVSIAATACLTFLACRKASRSAPLSAAIAIAWLVTSQGYWTQVSYHWLCAMFAMAAVWAVLHHEDAPGNDPRYPLIAGLAIGAAGMILPTVGALAALAALSAFVGPQRGRALIAYLIGCAIVPLLLIAGLAVQGTLVTAFEQAIVFPARHYAPIQGVAFGAGAQPQDRPMQVLYPLLVFATLYLAARDRKGVYGDRRFLTCVAFAVAGFIACFPRPDTIHIAMAAPLACPLLAAVLQGIAARWPRGLRYVAAGLALGLFVPSVIAFADYAKSVRHVETAETARGPIRLQGQGGLKEILAGIAATPATDRYLFYPYMPLLPFLTAREHVARYDLFVPGYAPGYQYREACVAAMRDAAWVVVDRSWTDPVVLQATFPSMRETAPAEMTAFRAALDSGFDVTVSSGTFELRQRTSAANESLCAGIPD